MPGVYKGECGANVDQMPYLTSPDKGWIEAVNKPYDIKRSSWVKDEKEGFVAGESQSEQGDQVTMKTITNQTLIMKKDDIQQTNHPKFYQASDMADMTFLNEASVLDNLHQCYINMRIYMSVRARTYSGLFRVTVSPYRWLPIHGARVANMGPTAAGCGRGAVPRALVALKPVWWELGHGRRSVVPCLSLLTPYLLLGSAGPLTAWGRGLGGEEDNFICIHFGATGKLVGADIESCESSLFHRVFGGQDQLPLWGSQELPGVLPPLALQEAFDVLGFSAQKTDLYKLTGAHHALRQLADKVAHLMGLSFRERQKGITRLRVKVGNELVQEGQNTEQCQKSIGALGKAMYDKMFKCLAVRINKILDTKMQRRFFTGVLDIAGFKILEACLASRAKDAHLIMHQLACNGILEGLRICGKGFPNRLQYPEYHVLNPNVIPQRFVNKKASELLLGSINLDVNEYKIGHIKVFFQAGILARLEDMRDECPAKLMSTLQRRLCGFLIKPLLNMARQEEEMKVREEGLRSATAKAQELLGKVVELEEKTATLSRENDLTDQLQAAHPAFDQRSFPHQEQENLLDVEERLTPMMKAKIGLESPICNMRERLEEQEGLSAPLSSEKRKLEGELSDLRRDLEGWGDHAGQDGEGEAGGEAPGLILVLPGPGNS
ncbi:unnamed protein product [Rangifer tarandus platyrhynchus]|uniref:Uncharacterized protein n=1 Tax=Rangifer tarandus platyrhynchus TaxID=3082113 RepID=A0AC59ZRJ3_RANTA